MMSQAVCKQKCLRALLFPHCKKQYQSKATLYITSHFSIQFRFFSLHTNKKGEGVKKEKLRTTKVRKTDIPDCNPHKSLHKKWPNLQL